MLEFPFYNSIRERLILLFQTVVLGSLKTFYQLDHQVDFISVLVSQTPLHSITLEEFNLSDSTLMYF